MNMISIGEPQRVIFSEPVELPEPIRETPEIVPEQVPEKEPALP